MFHVSEGLYFRRNEDGGVTIVKTSDGMEPGDTNIAFIQTMDDGSWCSVVLSMSAFSERPGDWHAWLQHHKGEKDLLSGRWS